MLPLRNRIVPSPTIPASVFWSQHQCLARNLVVFWDGHDTHHRILRHLSRRKNKRTCQINILPNPTHNSNLSTDLYFSRKLTDDRFDCDIAGIDFTGKFTYCLIWIFVRMWINIWSTGAKQRCRHWKIMTLTIITIIAFYCSNDFRFFFAFQIF